MNQLLTLWLGKAITKLAEEGLELTRIDATFFELDEVGEYYQLNCSVSDGDIFNVATFTSPEDAEAFLRSDCSERIYEVFREAAANEQFNPEVYELREEVRNEWQVIQSEVAKKLGIEVIQKEYDNFVDRHCTKHGMMVSVPEKHQARHKELKARLDAINRWQDDLWDLQLPIAEGGAGCADYSEYDHMRLGRPKLEWYLKKIKE